MTNATVSDTLNTAAYLIQIRGWGQGPSTWGDAEAQSRLCIEGAITAAAGVPMLTIQLSEDDAPSMTPSRTALEACPAYRAVHDYLQHREFSPLYIWNDQAGRTQEQVIEVLRAAAGIEEAKERKATEVEA